MIDFKDSVPFDPGFSVISFPFADYIESAYKDFNAIKIPHQKKFWLTRCSSSIVEFIEKGAAFYLGCMLWGAFIHYRFGGKKIDGNNTDGLNEEQQKSLDCAVEVKEILNRIDELEKNCKYYLKKSSKVSDFVVHVLKTYVEFVNLNNNFIGLKNTSDIKMPKEFAHMQNMTNEQLNKLGESIYNIIETGKINKLLEIGFYNKK